jgi:hypothetical protein
MNRNFPGEELQDAISHRGFSICKNVEVSLHFIRVCVCVCVPISIWKVQKQKEWDLGKRILGI